MKLQKPKFWSKKNSFYSFLLLPISIFIQFLFFFKKEFSKRKKISLPVICVGNIYIGGTGKTPLSLELVRILQKLNMKPVLIKKLYKEHVDEFNLLESKKIKVIKNSSRYEALLEAEKKQFKSVVLDDGFQDHSIYKNLSILCFNAKQLIGNGLTLPAGPLREPLSTIKYSQIILINGKKNEIFEKKLKSINKKNKIFYSRYVPINIKKYLNQNLLVFAGIGNPENFFELLRENKMRIKKQISFPDHYNYSQNEIKNLITISKKKGLKILTTEKDFFRIKHYNLSKINYLNIKLEITNKVSFEKEIKKYLK